MSVAPGRPGDSRRLSVARAHAPPQQQRAASHLTMSNRVIPFFVFGAGLLRFSNVGSFPQKWPPADARSRHAHVSHLLPSRQQQFRPPDEGWMERRQAALILSVAPATRDPLSRGDRDLSRRSTVAVFGCGPTKPAPGSGTPEPQRLPAPRHNGLAVGVRTSLRCGSRRKRGTPLLAPSFRIVSGDAPHERGWQIIYTNPVT